MLAGGWDGELGKTVASCLLQLWSWPSLPIFFLLLYPEPWKEVFTSICSNLPSVKSCSWQASLHVPPTISLSNHLGCSAHSASPHAHSSYTFPTHAGSRHTRIFAILQIHISFVLFSLPKWNDLPLLCWLFKDTTPFKSHVPIPPPGSQGTWFVHQWISISTIRESVHLHELYYLSQYCPSTDSSANSGHTTSNIL